MPCRRSRCSRCCRNNKAQINDESEEPVLSATSSATTTNLELIDETEIQPKTSCWPKFNCCKRCKKKPPPITDLDDEISEAMQECKMATIHEETKSSTAAILTTSLTPLGPPKQTKCGMFLSKVFCCRSVNKVDPTTGNETEVNKCCFCIPCYQKRGAGIDRGSAVSSVGADSAAMRTTAWEDPELGINTTDVSVLEGADETAKEYGCCKRFWCQFLCCKKQQPPKTSESRRASMKTTAPPIEDTRRKLHVDLVEYNSKMKGAIPVLPLYLAWFCALCNTVLPGLGTLLSGFFCICVGIPRFSQYDSAKARVGSLIINTIVAMAQLFCVLFCFVGWGWSIWWGTIMLKCAKKLSKIKKVERLEMEEEKRQAELYAAATRAESETTKT